MRSLVECTFEKLKNILLIIGQTYQYLKDKQRFLKILISINILKFLIKDEVIFVFKMYF